MPYKDKSVRVAYHKQRSREYYLRNKEKVIARTLASKKQGKEEWVKFKSTLKCTICGFDHPAALDFHHVDPTKKENIVSALISTGCYKAAMREVEKCVVLCANHHRVLHAEERKNPAF